MWVDFCNLAVKRKRDINGLCIGYGLGRSQKLEGEWALWLRNPMGCFSSAVTAAKAAVWRATTPTLNLRTNRQVN